MTNWKQLHQLAKLEPTLQELPLISLMSALEVLVARHAHDYVLREGIAEVILGTRRLLVGPFGDRLDKGLISHELADLAEKINYNLDVEKFEDE